MITLNNSNIDFDINNSNLGSKYSISLSFNTSNFIFKTNDVERITIINNGNVGIGKTITSYKLDIDGIINASTFYINGIDNNINNTSNYVGITTNILIGRINDTSNYVRMTSNILIGRINDTSNYVRKTSNILIGRINDTSNYVRTTSNILIGRINDTSNYVRKTSNILIGRVNDTNNYVRTTSNTLIGRLNDTSNYVRTTSNILISCISNTNNYVRTTSNILIGRINDTSNYGRTISNILIGRISDTSNYVRYTSNILIGPINDTRNYIGYTSNILASSINNTTNYIGTTSNILVCNINDTSNYVAITSNILIGRANDTSNYIGYTSNIMTSCINDTINYARTTSNTLIGGINDTNNYVRITSNILIGRINDTSDYIGYTSNILTSYINDTSNYVRTASNILIGRINDTSNYVRISETLIDRANNTSNYAVRTSNALIVRINDTSNYVIINDTLIGRVNNTSNYVRTASNILIGCINDTINYVRTTSNILIDCINNTSNYVRTASNILIGSINDTSNYVRISKTLIDSANNTSNYIGTASNILIGRIIDTSNYVRTTSNILIGRINDTINYVRTTSNTLIGGINDTSNYVKITSDIFRINNFTGQLTNWMDSSNMIYYNTSNVGIGIDNPNNKLHLYDNVNLITEAIIQNDSSNFYDIVDELVNSDVVSVIHSLGKERIITYRIGSTVPTPTYSFTVPSSGIMCDILMIGGGGSGGKGSYYISSSSPAPYAVGSGGGAGACIVAINQIFTSNARVTINVGQGGGFDTNGVSGSSGKDSQIIINGILMYVAKGGGAGKDGLVEANVNKPGNSGGCGGGSSVLSYATTNSIATAAGGAPLYTNIVGSSNVGPINSQYTTYAVLGNRGGATWVPSSEAVGVPYTPSYNNYRNMLRCPGGGGIGTPGSTIFSNSKTTIPMGNGGEGLNRVVINGIAYNFKEHFSANNNWGYDSSGNLRDGYIGGGGGGSGNELYMYGGTGGKGGGGNGFGKNTNSQEGEQATGGGGGGWANTSSYGVWQTAGMKGGSGLIIIRYRKIQQSSRVKLIRQISTNTNVEYSIANFDNKFKISSFTNNTTTEILVINSNGNVSIGGSVGQSANYRLEVFCNLNNSPNIIEIQRGKYIFENNYGYIEINTTIPKNTLKICAYFGGSIWVKGLCVGSSDIRIKEDIQDINYNNALQMILAIELKTYKYIDKIEKGNNKEYGFIAQQIQKVIPDAVILEKSYIPNIMTVANYDNKIITLLHKPANVLIKIKDKIKCFDSNNICIEIEIFEIINDLTFKIKNLEKEYTDNKIFLYGTYVEDFHILSRDHIYTLNVGATHELHRLIKENSYIIKSQKRINKLEQQHAILNKNYERLLKDIILIKGFIK